MNIGIPKEIKVEEHRVSSPPSGVREFVKRGHTVFVESDAGLSSGFTNEEYIGAGATIMDSAEALWTASDMIIKVKEPQASEYRYLRPNLILFAYLHLAAEKELTFAMLESGVTGIAYETVEDGQRGLPLLEPMSEVAGRMAAQVVSHYLERHQGGRGMLMGRCARRRSRACRHTGRWHCRHKCGQNRSRNGRARYPARYQSRPFALPRRCSRR